MNKLKRLAWLLPTVFGFVVIIKANNRNNITRIGLIIILVGFILGLVSIIRRLGISRIKFLATIWIATILMYFYSIYVIEYSHKWGLAESIMALALMVAGFLAMIVYSIID